MWQTSSPLLISRSEKEQVGVGGRVALGKRRQKVKPWGWGWGWSGDGRRSFEGLGETVVRQGGAGEQTAPLPAEAERRLSRLRERDGAPRMPAARPPHTTPLLSESEPGDTPVLLLLLVPRSPLVGPLDSLGQRGAPEQAAPSSSHRPAGSRAVSPPLGRGSGSPDIAGLLRAGSSRGPRRGRRTPSGRCRAATRQGAERVGPAAGRRSGGALSPARTQTWGADAGPGPPWVHTAAAGIGARASGRKMLPAVERASECEGGSFLKGYDSPPPQPSPKKCNQRAPADDTWDPPQPPTLAWGRARLGAPSCTGER